MPAGPRYARQERMKFPHMEAKIVVLSPRNHWQSLEHKSVRWPTVPFVSPIVYSNPKNWLNLANRR